MENYILVINQSGSFSFLNEGEFKALINEEYSEIEKKLPELLSKLFIIKKENFNLSLRLLATSMATRKKI